MGNFIKKETLAQVFSCEFCKISKNTFFTEHLWATASVIAEVYLKSTQFLNKKVSNVEQNSKNHWKTFKQ